MKKILLIASAVILGVACLSSIKVQSFADCDGECEIPNGPGGSAYVFIPLPGYISNISSEGSPVNEVGEGVIKKGRVIGNNEFGFGTDQGMVIHSEDEQERVIEDEEEIDTEDEMVIDPSSLPVEQ